MVSSLVLVWVFWVWCLVPTVLVACERCGFAWHTLRAFWISRV